MRILIAHSRYLTGDVSGENRVVDDEVLLLREAGHRVWLLDPSTRAGSGRELVRASIAAVYARQAVRELRAGLERFRPDIVHVHNLLPSLSPAILGAAASAGVAVVLTLHNYRLLCLPGTFLRAGRPCEDCLGRVPWRGVVHGCFRDSAAASLPYALSLTLHRMLGSFQGVSRYVAVSAFVAEKYRAAGVPAEKIVVKPNFAWPVLKKRRGAGRYFLFLGRLAPEKDVATLLEAWSPDYPPLVIAGDGPDEARLRAAAIQSVRFLGRIPPDDVPGVLAGARALLLPARSYEGCPRTVCEANAAGVPVVATSTRPLHEVVEDGRSGILVSRGDPAEWREAVERLLDDDESRRLGSGAYSKWESCFTPQRSLELLESIYKEALRGQTEPASAGDGGPPPS